MKRVATTANKLTEFDSTSFGYLLNFFTVE